MIKSEWNYSWRPRCFERKKMGLRRPTPSLTISGAVGAGRGSSKAPSRDLLKRMRIGLETRSCDGAAYVTLDTDEVRRAATSLEAESQTG